VGDMSERERWNVDQSLADERRRATSDVDAERAPSPSPKDKQRQPTAPPFRIAPHTEDTTTPA
jgi:hypothetical protein